MVRFTDEPSPFRAFRAGSRNALEYYLNLDGEKIFQYLDKKIGDEKVANELTFNVFAISYEKRAQFSSEGVLRPCFFHTARRLAQAYLWDKGKIKKVEIDLLFTSEVWCSDGDAAEIKRVQVLTELRGSFLKLSVKKRRILVDYYFRKKTTREIAHRYRIAPQTALNHKSQALDILRMDFWGKWGENNPFLA